MILPGTGRREFVRHDHARHGTHHEDLAVGEVDEAEHAVDHRVAECDQAVERALRQPRDNQTLELVPAESARAGIGPLGEEVVGIELLRNESDKADGDDGEER